MKSEFKKARSLIFQILTLLVLFTIVFIILRQANLIRFPNFIENLFVKEQHIVNEEVTDRQEIFEYIDSLPYVSELHSYPEITVDNMNKLLNSLESHSIFYWESTSQVFSPDSSITKKCKSRISGNKYNVEIYDANNIVIKSFISNGTDTVISNFSSGKSSSSTYLKGIFDFYSDAGLISVDSFKDMDFSEGKTEIRHIKNEQYNLVSFKYTYDRNGVTVRNEYGISLDYGVVLFAECFENDIPVYKQSTQSIYPLTSLDDKLFTIN